MFLVTFIHSLCVYQFKVILGICINHEPLAAVLVQQSGRCDVEFAVPILRDDFYFCVLP